MTNVANDKSITNKRPQFGQRYLMNTEDVFHHNAWDNVEWTEEQESNARENVAKNSKVFMDCNKQNILRTDADRNWDKFYSVHKNRFFKDRHWLFTEFPELVPSEQLKPASPVRDELIETCDPHTRRQIFEIGCGVGNTIIPILQYCNDPNVYIYGCDFSRKAIDILKEHDEYDENRCHTFVCDITVDQWDTPFPTESIDIIVAVFILSALSPDKFRHVVKKLYSYLKPGGLVLFRDFGRYDMVQMRFKLGQCLENNFYARGDGTFAYFFTQEDIRSLFTGEGFTEEQNIVDRRLLVNRGQQLKMYRVWIQAKYRKPR